MKNLSSILLIAAMLSGAASSFASEPISSFARGAGDTIKLLSNEEFFYKADYIIEARPSDKGYIMYDAGGNYNPDEIYTSLFLIVTYVYKNNETMSISPGDTLCYIRKGGRIIKPSEYRPFDGEVIETPYPVDYDTRERGGVPIMPDEYQSILFVKKSDFPENPDVSKRNKHPKVSMLQDIRRASIKIKGDSRTSGGPVWGLNDLHFDNRYELYKYMEQFKDLKVPLSDATHIRWHSDDKTFEKYLKERKVKWQDTNDRQYIDSLNRALEIRAKRARENTEKKERAKTIKSRSSE